MFSIFHMADNTDNSLMKISNRNNIIFYVHIAIAILI